MNRRNFLASLIAIPAGVAAAVKAIRQPKKTISGLIVVPGEDLASKGITLTRASIQPLTPYDLEELQKADLTWMANRSRCYSQEYLDALDKIVAENPGCIEKWKEQFSRHG